MNAGAPRDRERLHHLMMAALDGESSPEERTELERALEEDAALRKEWTRMSRVKEVTRGMATAEPPSEIWDDYWDDVYRRSERKIGWALASIGASILLGFGMFEFFRALVADGTVPLPLKAALLLASLGGAVLLVSVAREKVFVRRRDPYRKVKR